MPSHWRSHAGQVQCITSSTSSATITPPPPANRDVWASECVSADDAHSNRAADCVTRIDQMLRYPRSGDGAAAAGRLRPCCPQPLPHGPPGRGINHLAGNAGVARAVVWPNAPTTPAPHRPCPRSRGQTAHSGADDARARPGRHRAPPATPHSSAPRGQRGTPRSAVRPPALPSRTRSHNAGAECSAARLLALLVRR